MFKSTRIANALCSLPILSYLSGVFIPKYKVEYEEDAHRKQLWSSS